MRTFSPTVTRVGVALAVEAGNLDELFEQVQTMVTPTGRFRSGEVARRLQARHSWRPTVVRAGVALPHADVRHLRHRCLLYLRALRGLDAGAPEPVADFVVLLAPYPSAPQDQQLLEHVHNGLMTNKLTAQLRAAPDSASATGVLHAHLGLLDLPCAPLAQQRQRHVSSVLHGF